MSGDLPKMQSQYEQHDDAVCLKPQSAQRRSLSWLHWYKEERCPAISRQERPQCDVGVTLLGRGFVSFNDCFVAGVAARS